MDYFVEISNMILRPEANFRYGAQVWFDDLKKKKRFKRGRTEAHNLVFSVHKQTGEKAFILKVLLSPQF